jgi:hypothetical protein
MRISAYCAECLARVPLPVPEGEAACPNGHGAVAFTHSAAVAGGSRVDRCSRCGATAFFAQKDFDQRLGCALLALGAGLALALARLFGGIWFVPALLAFTGLDLLIARRVGSVVICYRCDTEYRDVPDAASYKPYDPHVAERYAEAKTLRRLNP